MANNQVQGAGQSAQMKIFGDSEEPVTPAPRNVPRRHAPRSTRNPRYDSKPLSAIPSPNRLRKARSTRRGQATTPAPTSSGTELEGITGGLQGVDMEGKGKEKVTATKQAKNIMSSLGPMSSLERYERKPLGNLSNSIGATPKEEMTQLRTNSPLSNAPMVQGERSSSESADSQQENLNPAKDNLRDLLLNFHDRLPNVNKTLGQTDGLDIAELQKQIDKLKGEGNLEAVYVLEKMLKVMKNSYKLMKSMEEFERLVNSMGLVWDGMGQEAGGEDA